MPKDFLKGVRDRYDVVVIGSGLAGLKDVPGHALPALVVEE